MAGFQPQRWAGILAVLNIAMIAILLGPPRFSSASRPLRKPTDPGLAMEVVRNLDEVDAILSDAPSPDREVMRLKQYADFGFIACYAALYVVMSMMLAHQGRRIAISAAIVGITAAVCDVTENLGILRVVNADLAHTTQAMIDRIRYPSLAKWALASLAVGLLAILLLRMRSAGARIVGAFNLAAAALGLYGVYDNAFLAWAGLPMLAGFLGLAVLYFRPKVHAHS